MRGIVLSLFALCLGGMVTPAAAVDPLVDYPDQPVLTGSGKPPTDDAVKKAISNAATKLNWQISPGAQGDSLVVAHYRGQHIIVLDITWNAEQYSLSYKDSTAMSYRLKDGKAWIHSAYQRTVSTLMNGIRNELRLL